MEMLLMPRTYFACELEANSGAGGFEAAGLDVYLTHNAHNVSLVDSFAVDVVGVGATVEARATTTVLMS